MIVVNRIMIPCTFKTTYDTISCFHTIRKHFLTTLPEKLLSVSRRPCFAGPSGSRCSPSILKAFFGISCKHDSSQAFRLRRLFSRRSSPRPISSSQLHALLHFHLCPIYLVVFKGSYSYDGISILEGGFTLRCLQRLSRPDLATRLCTWQYNRYTSGQSIPVLSY